jgi:hypothetical protein
MADENGRALGMVTAVEQMCVFIEHPAIKAAVKGEVPVTMRQEVGALGFNKSFWVGFGTVGLWAALDAFSERADLGGGKCDICKKRNCIVARFPRVQGDDRQSLGELDDLRHLYAHNYAGEADEKYFKKQTRHVLTRHVLARGGVELTCGAQFDGRRVQLEVSHLRYYCETARRVLKPSSALRST